MFSTYNLGVHKMKRREFINTSSKIICACASGIGLVAMSSCAENVVEPIEKQNSDVQFDIDINLDEYSILKSEGGSVVTSGNSVNGQGLLLVRVDAEVRAFENNCTHSGYDLYPFNNGISNCTSSHGGQFNTNGEAVSSPASGRLQEYATELNGNNLTIFG